MDSSLYDCHREPLAVKLLLVGSREAQPVDRKLFNISNKKLSRIFLKFNEVRGLTACCA